MRRNKLTMKESFHSLISAIMEFYNGAISYSEIMAMDQPTLHQFYNRVVKTEALRSKALEKDIKRLSKK